MTIKELLDRLTHYPPETVVFTAGCPAKTCKGLVPADGVEPCTVELSQNHDDDRVKVDGVAIGRNESADYEYEMAKAATKMKLLGWLALSGALAHSGMIMP